MTMGQILTFGISAWSGWLPGRQSMSLGGAASPRGALPVSLRRRITPIGRQVMEAAWAVLPEGGQSPRIVLSSRHGEYSRTFGLLGSLAESGEVSPAEFSLSVHHALAGLLSIATGNRAGHTAVAAGSESFGYGLLEAAACLAEDAQPVLLLHFDEALPGNYASIAGVAEDAVALACLLVPAETPGGQRISFDFRAATVPGNDPLAQCFAAFLDSHDHEASGTGDRLTWRWRRAA